MSVIILATHITLTPGPTLTADKTMPKWQPTLLASVAERRFIMQMNIHQATLTWAACNGAFHSCCQAAHTHMKPMLKLQTQISPTFLIISPQLINFTECSPVKICLFCYNATSLSTYVHRPVQYLYTVFQKKTSTHIIGYKLRNSCLILIIFDTKIPHIIWHRVTA